jgi:hypothetical protein
MKKTTQIAIAVGAAGAAFLLWKNWDKIFKKKEGDLTLPENTENATASTEPGKDGAPSQYETLAMKLQELLGVGVDGKPGKQTNGKLEYLFSVSDEALNPELAFAQKYPNLAKYGKGVVSPENVNWYLAVLNSKTTPRELTPLRRRMEAIKAGIDAGKVGQFVKSMRLPLAYSDSITNSMRLTGGYATISAGTKFNYYAASSWTNATIYIRVVVDSVPRIVKVSGRELENLTI